MKLSDSVAEQLRKFNYTVSSLDELFSLLPTVICSRIGKSIKRIPAIFILQVEDSKYTLSLIISSGENEPTILQKRTDRNLSDVIGKMIIYLEQSNLIDGG